MNLLIKSSILAFLATASGVYANDDYRHHDGRLRGAASVSYYEDVLDAGDWDDKEDNFVQVQNGEGDRCKFPFPNCGNGLVCVNRLNDDPVCHRRGECYPRGFKAPSSGFHEFAVCCSNTGANGHCL